MKRIWFTSDSHFGHDNIIKYCKRPFANVEEMDAALISNWNEKVKPDDTIYHLGDFTLGKDIEKYISQLNGSIEIIPGGHDWRWRKELKQNQVIITKSNDFFVIYPPLHILENVSIIKRPIVLCHYPMLSWEGSHYGSIHLHGHTHGTISIVGESGDRVLPLKSSGGKNGKRMDVGVDAHNFYPISLEEVLEKLQ